MLSRDYPLPYILSMCFTDCCGILSRYLYDRLKKRKETEISINNISIEINAERIEQLILATLKEKEDK